MVSTRHQNAAILAAVAILVAACGGGGGEAGTPLTGTNNPPTAGTPSTPTTTPGTPTGGTATAPTFQTQPANASVLTDATASFTVTASGSDLVYQWKRNGADIAGATSTTYTTPPATYANHGDRYTVVVSNKGGSVSSNAAQLTLKLSANQQAKSSFGIRGRVNRNGNDGTVTRFGWKAQNKSLAIFAGEAYNVEQGVTSELFPNEREESTGCALNNTPEDHADFITESGDVEEFMAFMKFAAPPSPAAKKHSGN